MNALTAPPLPLSGPVPTLKEMLEDAIYLLFLLRSGNGPASAGEFTQRVERALDDFERNARNYGKPAQAIQDAKYAVCAVMDEIILGSDFPLRDEWERAPLQLRLFGEHLAGERFFDRLEALRLDPVSNLETLEVFQTCLLLGFQGKYLLEGREKLDYLITRIGQEITNARGGRAEFAPNWKLPHRFQQYVRHELPLWLFYALLAGVVAAVFLVYTWLLDDQVSELARLQAQGRPTATSALTVSNKPE